MTAPAATASAGDPRGARAAQRAAVVLRDFHVPFEVTIVSAHRTPLRMVEYARTACERGIKGLPCRLARGVDPLAVPDQRPCRTVIIAGAGGAAHLPGMVASLTSLPVIGVPIPLKAGSVLGSPWAPANLTRCGLGPADAQHLSGLDSLYSIVQMPQGVPCATVAIENSANAALLAVRMLSIQCPSLRAALVDYQAGSTSGRTNPADWRSLTLWRQCCRHAWSGMC